MSDKIEAEILDVLSEEVGANVDTPYFTIAGPKGDTGATGQSAYELAVQEGFDGDLNAWLASIKGDKGEKGDTGATGAKGDTGATGPEGAKGAKGEKGDAGAPGIYIGADAPAGDAHPVWVDPNGDADAGELLPTPASDKSDDGKTMVVEGNEWKLKKAASGDGETPHIGDNGHWYIGDTDTGVAAKGDTGPAGPQGEKGDKGDTGPAGAPGKDGAGMDITGAKVGQIAKITAVDASGVPTAWEPVDMPGSGGDVLILDYIHDDSKFSPGRPAIHPIAYDADTKVWTADASVDLTTLAAVGTAVYGRYQLCIIDPLSKLGADFDIKKWCAPSVAILTVLSANTFSTDFAPSRVMDSWTDYIFVSNEQVNIPMPSTAGEKIRMIFDGAFTGPTRYAMVGTTQWFDPNGATTFSPQFGYQQRKGFYTHIVCDFDLVGGKIFGTVSEQYVSFNGIGSAEGIYFPLSAKSWPDLLIGAYATIGYSAMPYGARLRIYNRG